MKRGAALRTSAVAAVAVALGACTDDAPAPTSPAAPGATPAASEPAGPLAFTDVTLAAGLPEPRPAPDPTQILEVKGGGVALFDADGDGDLDLFVPGTGTLDEPESGTSRLFESTGDLRFRATEAASGFRRWGMGVAVGDTDADGDDDVFVACYGADGWLENTSRSGALELRERDVGVGSTAWGMAAAFGDLDTDGDLDLYVANYLEFDAAHPPPGSNFLGVPVFGGPRPLPPQADVLYRNDDGHFSDATVASGCGAVTPSYGLGVVVLDFDDDGRQDVFVGNDSMENFLFLGDGRLRFEEVGRRSGIATDADGSAQATMGIAVGDVDGDLSPDVFTSNFQGDANTLHVRRGETSYHDATRRFRLGAVSRTFVGWAALFGDFDHDTDEDLLVFNGHVYSDAVANELGTTRAQQALYFARDGETFRRLEADEGGTWLAAPLCARGGALGDLDGDSDLDVVVVEVGGAVHVLRNDATLAPALVIELEGPPGNPHALGARIVATVGERRFVRWIHTAGGYQSTGAAAAHFALPAGAPAVELEVTWPDGIRSKHTVAADRAGSGPVRLRREAEAR